MRILTLLLIIVSVRIQTISKEPKILPPVLLCTPSQNEIINKALNKYFKDCEDAKIAWAIAQAECHGKFTCNNKGLNKDHSIDFGFMQINSIHKEKSESIESFEHRMSNLEENLKLASKVFKDAGNSFSPWVTYNTGKYLQYVK